MFKDWMEITKERIVNQILMDESHIVSFIQKYREETQMDNNKTTYDFYIKLIGKFQSSGKKGYKKAEVLSVIKDTYIELLSKQDILTDLRTGKA